MPKTSIEPNTIKPISPEEADEQKILAIPDFVIAAFNTCIIKNLKNGKATVKQDDVVAEIQKHKNIDKHIIFENQWLDVEDLYRAEGWRVLYDKPGFNEGYSAYFVFSKEK